MLDQIRRAIKLAKITGDRVILIDQNNPEEAFVIMNIDEYEKLLINNRFKSKEVVNLTESELIDRINRDIAMWKSEQATEPWEDKDSFNKEKMEGSAGNSKDENLYYYGEDNHQNGCLENEDKISEIDYGLNVNFDDDDMEFDFESEQSIKKSVKKPWRIPETVKKAAEEVLEENNNF